MRFSRTTRVRMVAIEGVVVFQRYKD